jgi:hypothetical protein
MHAFKLIIILKITFPCKSKPSSPDTFYTTFLICIFCKLQIVIVVVVFTQKYPVINSIYPEQDSSNTLYLKNFIYLTPYTGACTITLITAAFTDFRNKLERLSLASFSGAPLLGRLRPYPQTID